MSGSGSRNFISLRGSTSRNDIFFRPTLVCESPILTPRIWLLDFIPQEANLFKIHRIPIKSQYNLHQIIKSSNPIKFHEITINSPSTPLEFHEFPAFLPFSLPGQALDVRIQAREILHMRPGRLVCGFVGGLWRTGVSYLDDTRNSSSFVPGSFFCYL